LEGHEHFELTLRGEPGYDVPAVVRLRAFLKDCLRRYGLRCVRAKQVDEAETSEAAPEPAEAAGSNQDAANKPHGRMKE
jgi:hypothetical protein